jgi:hypothetical protein
MMDMYSLQRLAHTEHDLMVRSLPKVYDFDYPFPPQQSRWSRLVAGFRTLAGHVLTSPPTPPRRSRPSLTVSNPSSLLCDMVREDSNYELDWLWAAEQVTAADEIRYCLERALYINPDNQDAQRILSKLSAHRAADETVQVNRQGFAQASDN